MTPEEQEEQAQLRKLELQMDELYSQLIQKRIYQMFLEYNGGNDSGSLGESVWIINDQINRTDFEAVGPEYFYVHDIPNANLTTTTLSDIDRDVNKALNTDDFDLMNIIYTNMNFGFDGNISVQGIVCIDPVKKKMYFSTTIEEMVANVQPLHVVDFSDSSVPMLELPDDETVL
jgi:methionyl-tRNA synthetase